MSDKKKTVSVLLDFDTWLKFKIWCAKQDKKIASVLAELVNKLMEGEE